MKPIIQELEAEERERQTQNKDIPSFGAGDNVRVNVRVVEGNRERVQAFDGTVIAFKKRGINSSFRVRKYSFGEGVERVFPLYSPNIDSIQVLKRGDVRRAKLYYLRSRKGKSARIPEKTTGDVAKQQRQAAGAGTKQRRSNKKRKTSAQKQG
mgnify:CR=1 FL=1